MSQRLSKQYTTTGLARSSCAALSALSVLSAMLTACGRCASAYSTAGSTSTSCAPPFSRRLSPARSMLSASATHLHDRRGTRFQQRTHCTAPQLERRVDVEDDVVGARLVPGARRVNAGEKVDVAAERAGDVGGVCDLQRRKRHVQ